MVSFIYFFFLPSASLLAFSCLWLTFLISFCCQLSCFTPSSFKIIILDYLLDDFHAFCLHSMISSVLLVDSCFSLFPSYIILQIMHLFCEGTLNLPIFQPIAYWVRFLIINLGEEISITFWKCVFSGLQHILSQFLLPVRQVILYYNKDYYWIFYLLCHVRFQRTDLITPCQMRWKHVAWSGVLNTCSFLSFLFREKVNLGHNFIKSYHVEEWALAHEVSWFSLYFSVTILTFKLPWGTRTWLISTMW